MTFQTQGQKKKKIHVSPTDKLKKASVFLEQPQESLVKAKPNQKKTVL